MTRRISRKTRRLAVELLLTAAGDHEQSIDRVLSPKGGPHRRLAYAALWATDDDAGDLNTDCARAARWVAAGWSPGDPPLDADPLDDLDMLELLDELGGMFARARRLAASEVLNDSVSWSHHFPVMRALLIRVDREHPQMDRSARMRIVSSRLLAGWCPP